MPKLPTDEGGNPILPPGAVWDDQPLPTDMPPPSLSPSQQRLKSGGKIVTSEPPLNIGKKTDPLTEILSQFTDVGAQGLQMTGLFEGGPFGQPKTARSIAKNVIPQTPTELGIFIATLPVGPEVGALGRVLKMTAGGALGGMTGEGGSTSVSGAFQGLMGGITGEGINKLSRMVTYVPWVKRIAQSDAETVGQAAFDMVPELGKLKSPQDFQATFSRIYGQRKLSQMYDGSIKSIVADLGDKNLVTSPTLGQTLWGEATGDLTSYRMQSSGAKPAMQVPFEVAIDKVRDLKEKARRLVINQPIVAADYRNRANAIETEAVMSLPPELQNRYMQAKNAYAKGRAMLHFFDPKNAETRGAAGEGVLNESGWLDVEKLQNRFKKQGLGSREALFSASEVAKFQDALFRGSETGSRITDLTPETPMHARLHKFGVSIPLFEALTQETRYVGNTPSRGNIPAPLASILGGKASAGVLSNRPQDRAPITLNAPSEGE